MNIPRPVACFQHKLPTGVHLLPDYLAENIRKGNNKPISSFNIKNKKQKNYESITSASLELDISFSIISNICRLFQKKTGIDTHLNI